MGLGDQAGELAHGVGQRGQRPEPVRPWVRTPLCHGRFARVVEYEGESGHQGGSPDGGGQLMRQDDQVVDESGLCDGPESAKDVGSQQPLGVGFALDLVADSDEQVAAGQGAQGGERLVDVRCGEVGPPDDTRDETAVRGESEELGVSSATVTVWTRTVARTPAARASGSRSARVKVRRIGASSSPVIQSWSRTARSQT